MATLAEKKEAFIKLFGSDPDIAKIPLPDSIRDRLGVYQDISYMPLQKAVNSAIFNGNRYTGMEERVNDPAVEFPDLTKFKKADEETEETT